MKIVAERLIQLRKGAKLSQVKLSALIGCSQTGLARYESGQGGLPLPLLLWYADYFNVSLDYIFGRTDNPEGKLYAYNPRVNADTTQLKQFIEMCFDPNSLVSEKLKNTMMEIFLKEVDGQ